MVPRYQRRMREVNEAVASVYLSGGNTRRIRGALRPLLKNAPLSKSAVSRIVGTLRGEWEAWRKQSLADLNVVYLYLDAIALRVCAAGRVTGLPVLAGIAVLSDGSKRLVSLGVCGAESGAAWEGFLQGLIDRGLKAPRLCIIDGNAGLHRAITSRGAARRSSAAPCTSCGTSCARCRSTHTTRSPATTTSSCTRRDSRQRRPRATPS